MGFSIIFAKINVQVRAYKLQNGSILFENSEPYNPMTEESRADLNKLSKSDIYELSWHGNQRYAVADRDKNDEYVTRVSANWRDILRGASASFPQNEGGNNDGDNDTGNNGDNDTANNGDNETDNEGDNEGDDEQAEEKEPPDDEDMEVEEEEEEEDVQIMPLLNEDDARKLNMLTRVNSGYRGVDTDIYEAMKDKNDRGNTS